jgi:hypothetical protein
MSVEYVFFDTDEQEEIAKFDTLAEAESYIQTYLEVRFPCKDNFYYVERCETDYKLPHNIRRFELFVLIDGRRNYLFR